MKDNISKISSEVSDMNPYKQSGNRDSYSSYNEGWADACDVLEQRLLAELTEPARPSEWSIKDINKAKKYLSDAGYGTGTNFTVNTVANLMAKFSAKHHTPTEKDHPKQSAEEWLKENYPWDGKTPQGIGFKELTELLDQYATSVNPAQVQGGEK